MRGPGLLVAAIMISVSVLGGCLDGGDGMGVDPKDGFEDTVSMEIGHTSFSMDEDSLYLSTDEAKVFALRFHLEEETTLEDFEARFSGTRGKEKPPVGIFWFFFWRDGDRVPSPVDLFGAIQHYAEIALFPSGNGPEAQVNYPYGKACEFIGDCWSSGLGYTFTEDIVLAAGDWWFVFGKTSESTHEAEFKLNVGSSQIRPSSFYVGNSCDTLGHWDMGGTVRLYTLFGPSWFEDLEARIPTEDHLFMVRIGYPIFGQFEEALHLPNGTVLEASKQIDEDAVWDWPGIVYTDEGAGMTVYEVPHSLSPVLSYPFILSYCTFSHEGLIDIDWSGAS